MCGRCVLRQLAFDKAGAGDDDIDRAFLILHDAVEAIEIIKIGDVGLHGRDVLADLGLRLVEFALAAANDEDVSAFIDEFLRGRKPDTA